MCSIWRCLVSYWGCHLLCQFFVSKVYSVQITLNARGGWLSGSPSCSTPSLYVWAFCKLVHIARSKPPSLVALGFKYFDNDVRHCFVLCTGVDTSNSAWEQAQISLSRGGLGLRRLFISLLHSMYQCFKVVFSTSPTSFTFD